MFFCSRRGRVAGSFLLSVTCYCSRLADLARVSLGFRVGLELYRALEDWLSYPWCNKCFVDAVLKC